MDRYHSIGPCQGSGEDKKPRNAIEEKAASHIPPPKGIEGYIEHKIEHPHLQGGHEVVDDQGYAGKSRGKELLGNQDPLDYHSTEHASQGNEYQVPQHLSRRSQRRCP